MLLLHHYYFYLNGPNLPSSGPTSSILTPDTTQHRLKDDNTYRSAASGGRRPCHRTVTWLPFIPSLTPSQSLLAAHVISVLRLLLPWALLTLAVTNPCSRSTICVSSGRKHARPEVNTRLLSPVWRVRLFAALANVEHGQGHSATVIYPPLAGDEEADCQRRAQEQSPGYPYLSQPDETNIANIEHSWSKLFQRAVNQNVHLEPPPKTSLTPPLTRPIQKSGMCGRCDSTVFRGGQERSAAGWIVQLAAMPGGRSGRGICADARQKW